MKRQAAGLRRPVSARRWIDSQRPAKGSDHFQSILSLPLGSRIVLCSRDSSRPQRSNLDVEALNLREEVERLRPDLVIVGEHKRIWPGACPGWLVPVVEEAKANGADALVFESTVRAVRHPRYNPKHDKDLQARESDCKDLKAVTGDLILSTLVDPNAGSEEIKAYETRRGMKHGNRGGRPPKVKASGEQLMLRKSVVGYWKNLSGGKGRETRPS